MGQTMDQMKMINQLRKTQKELKNEIVEVEAGDGAVVIQHKTIPVAVDLDIFDSLLNACKSKVET